MHFELQNTFKRKKYFVDNLKSEDCGNIENKIIEILPVA